MIHEHTPPAPLRGRSEEVASFLSRSPRDSMSLARRERNAQLFDVNGYPDLSINQEQRRLMNDKTLQWTWLQCTLSYEEVDEHNVTRQRDVPFAMTDEEMFDYSVLHYFVVNAHATPASTYMTELGMDGTPYVRPDDPFEETRVRPIIIDKEELFKSWAIVAREKLREAIKLGDMTTARKVVDQEIGADFWSSHPELLLRLMLQYFVELVKKGKYAKAVKFSQIQVAPFVEVNPGYMVDLQRVFVVLAVDHEAPMKHPDTQAVRLLSKHRRYELFRDINDAILRDLTYEPCDFLQQANYMHAWFDEGMRHVVYYAEEKLKEQPTNQTRLNYLKCVKSWQSSLMSLEDVVQEDQDRWTALMDRVESEGLQPDPKVQEIIEKEFCKLQARLVGKEIDSSVEEDWLDDAASDDGM